jgi:hypothetical protein
MVVLLDEIAFVAIAGALTGPGQHAVCACRGTITSYG